MSNAQELSKVSGTSNGYTTYKLTNTLRDIVENMEICEISGNTIVLKYNKNNKEITDELIQHSLDIFQCIPALHTCVINDKWDGIVLEDTPEIKVWPIVKANTSINTQFSTIKFKLTQFTKVFSKSSNVVGKSGLRVGARVNCSWSCNTVFKSVSGNFYGATLFANRITGISF